MTAGIASTVKLRRSMRTQGSRAHAVAEILTVLWAELFLSTRLGFGTLLCASRPIRCCKSRSRVRRIFGVELPLRLLFERDADALATQSRHSFAQTGTSCCHDKLIEESKAANSYPTRNNASGSSNS